MDAGTRAIELPGPVACSFLPYSAHTHRLALLAHSRHKEVMLHLPMQTVETRPLDRGGLRLDMTHHEFVQALQQDLAEVPDAVGINNHMGSLLTRHPGHMLWLMQEINRRGNLFFVDSRTTRATVALQVAMENDVPSLKRDVFLDNDASPARRAAPIPGTDPACETGRHGRCHRPPAPRHAGGVGGHAADTGAARCTPGAGG